MFYYLDGTVAEILPGLAVIDCGGVGYACMTTNNTLSQLKKGEKKKLYTYLNVGESIFDLYGFATQNELNSFKLLLGVSGVGPKAALDLTDVRLMLEPAIAELAARNRTEEEAQRLTEYCDAVRRRIQAGEDYLIEDMRFHWYLAKCSHNMVVEPLMPIIDAAVVSIANITRKELLTATVDTHQEILNGVLDQDPQAARAAVALHLEMNRIVIKHAQKRSKETK